MTAFRYMVQVMTARDDDWPTTVGQSSSLAVITCPIYLNAVTFYKGGPYTSMDLSLLSLNYSSANRLLFRSTPLAHCAVSGCLTFSVLQGTSMSHQGHQGWGRFLYSKMTTVSMTLQCRKCTRIAVLVSSCPGHHSTVCK